MSIFLPVMGRLSSLFSISVCLLLLFSLQPYNAAAQTRITSWIGNVSSDWNTASNWTSGVPDPNTDVVIGGSSYGTNTLYYPVLDETNAVTINSLEVTSVGATKDVKLFIQNKTLLVTVKGNITTTGTGDLVNRGTDMAVGGNWLNSGKYTEEIHNITDKQGRIRESYYPTIQFTGVAKTVGGAAVNSFNHVTISGSVTLKSNLVINPLGTTLSMLESMLDIKGVLDPELNTVTFTAPPSDGFVVQPDATIKVKATTYAGNYGMQPTTMYTTSTVDYAAASGTQTVFSRNYGILKISGGGIKQLEANTTVSDVSAATQLIVEGGTLDLRTFTLNRTGSTSPVAGGTIVIANGAALKIGGNGTFPTGYLTHNLNSTSTVEYYGDNQTVANEAYGNLTLSGSGVKTMPAVSLKVTGTLLSAGSASFTARGDISVGGNVELSGTSVFNGGSFIHTVSGNWTDNATFTGASSTVVMAGSGKSIARTAAGVASFNNLNITGSGLNITAPALSVLGNLSTSGSGSFSQVGGGTVTMAGAAKTISGIGITFQSLTLDGETSTTASFEIQGNLTVNVGKSFTATAGTINMTGSGKTIAGTGNLSLYGIRVNGTVSTGSSFHINSDLSGAGKLTATAGVINFSGASTFNGVHDLYDVTVSGTLLRLVANANLGIAGAFTINTGATFDATTNKPNSVTFNGTAAQTVPGVTYHNLSLINIGAKTAAAAIRANGNLTIGDGATFNAGAHAHLVSGNWANSGTFNHNSGSITLDGGANTLLSGSTTFNVLTIQKATGNTVSQNSDITTATLNMTSGLLVTGATKVTVTASRTGNGWVIGTIRRTHVFAANTAYDFNGPYVEARFGTVSGVSDVAVTMSYGATANFPAGAAINTTFTVAIPTGTYTGATLQLQYQDAYLNGNNESELQLYRYNGSIWESKGKSQNNTTQNWVNQTAFADITGQWTLSSTPSILRWVGANSTAWELATNWENITNGAPVPAGSAPITTDIVELGNIAAVNQPTITSGVTVKGIQFKGVAPITLTIGAGSSLKVDGNLAATGAGSSVQHQLNVGDQSLQVGGKLILNDGSAGNSISLFMGAGTTTVAGDLNHSGSGFISLGSGNLKLSGNYNFSAALTGFDKGTGTFTYAGPNAQIVGIVYYNNVTIDKSAGVATLTAPAEGWIAGDVTLNNGTLSIPGGSYILEKSLIQNGGVLEVGSSTITVMGNWTKNGGVFQANSSNIILQGSSLVVNSALTFNNLKIDKVPGTTLAVTGSALVNDSLEVQSGTLDLGTSTLNRSAVGGKFIMGDTATLLLSGSNFPANYNRMLLSPLSTVKYQGAVAQDIAAVTYGNLEVVSGGTAAKKLLAATVVAGNLFINSDATLNANDQNLTIGGNLSNLGSFSAGTYSSPTPPTGTLVLASTGGLEKVISGNTVTVHNIVVQTGANFKLTTDLAIQGNAEIVGNERVYIDPLAASKEFDLTNNGLLNTGAATVSIAGNLFNAGILSGAGTRTFVGTRLQTIQLNAPMIPGAEGAPAVIFDGTVSPLFNSKAAPVFANIIIKNKGGLTPSTGWLVRGLMQVTEGASFDGGAHTHTIQTGIQNTGTIKSAGTINIEPKNLGQGLTTYPLYFGPSANSFQSTGTVRIGGDMPISLTGAVPLELHDVVLENTNPTGISLAPLAGTDIKITGSVKIGDGTTVYGGDKTYTIGGNLTNHGLIDAKDANIVFTATDADPGMTPEPALISGMGVSSFKNFTIAANAKVNLTKEAQLYGNFAHNGTSFDGTRAIIKFVGSAPSAISSAAGDTISIYQLYVHKADGAIVTLHAPLNRVSTLMVESGTFNVQNHKIVTTEELVTAEATYRTPYIFVGDGAVYRLTGGTFPLFKTYDLEPTSLVVYEGATQSIRSTQYGSLQLLGTGAKTFDGDTAKIAGTMTVAPEVSVVAPGLVEYNGGGAQGVAAINYNNLKLSSTGNKTLVTGTTGVANELTVVDNASIQAAGANVIVDYNGAIEQNVLPTNYYSLKLSNGSIKRFAGTTGIAADFSITDGATADLTAENTIEFNGLRNQPVPALNYKNLRITATGIKTLAGNATVEKQMTLTAGEVRTGSNRITLGTAEGTISETEAAYVTGTVETTRDVAAGVAQTFGGLGISIRPAVPAGLTKVTRVTGVPVGIENKSIARTFAVEPGTNNGSLDAVVSVSYFDHELNAIPENELVFYRSDNGVDDWQILPVENTTRDGASNSVAVTSLQKFSTVTLGSVASPLPVELIYFNAAKAGHNAVLSWATAMEENCKGFFIEVSTDGYAFRSLGFVPSQVTSSFAKQTYSFTDKENGKTSVRYYRLRQVDVDGDEQVFGVKALDFGTVVIATATTYPNPFSRSLTVSLSAPATGTAHIKLYSVTGKLLYEKGLKVPAGTMLVPVDVEKISRKGVYILTVELDGKHVSRLKVVRE